MTLNYAFTEAIVLRCKIEFRCRPRAPYWKATHLRKKRLRGLFKAHNFSESIFTRTPLFFRIQNNSANSMEFCIINFIKQNMNSNEHSCLKTLPSKRENSLECVCIPTRQNISAFSDAENVVCGASLFLHVHHCIRVTSSARTRRGFISHKSVPYKVHTHPLVSRTRCSRGRHQVSCVGERAFFFIFSECAFHARGPRAPFASPNGRVECKNVPGWLFVYYII